VKSTNTQFKAWSRVSNLFEWRLQLFSKFLAGQAFVSRYGCVRWCIPGVI